MRAYLSNLDVWRKKRSHVVIDILNQLCWYLHFRIPVIGWIPVFFFNNLSAGCFTFNTEYTC